MALEDKFNITYITSDGKKISCKEMFSQPFVVSNENNPDLYERALLIYDPARLEKIRKHQRMYEKTKERQAKLDQEFKKLNTK